MKVRDLPLQLLFPDVEDYKTLLHSPARDLVIALEPRVYDLIKQGEVSLNPTKIMVNVIRTAIVLSNKRIIDEKELVADDLGVFFQGLFLPSYSDLWSISDYAASVCSSSLFPVPSTTDLTYILKEYLTNHTPTRADIDQMICFFDNPSSQKTFVSSLFSAMKSLGKGSATSFLYTQDSFCATDEVEMAMLADVKAGKYMIMRVDMFGPASVNEFFADFKDISESERKLHDITTLHTNLSAKYDQLAAMNRKLMVELNACKVSANLGASTDDLQERVKKLEEERLMMIPVDYIMEQATNILNDENFPRILGEVVRLYAQGKIDQGNESYMPLLMMGVKFEKEYKNNKKKEEERLAALRGGDIYNYGPNSTHNDHSKKQNINANLPQQDAQKLIKQ